MKNKIIHIAAFGCVALTLIACGDDITQEINKSQGLESYAAINELPDCTSENEGEMAFVSKDAKVYYCADSSWQLLNGEDGENGKDGVDGTDGKDGTNGKDGLNGKDGVNGANGIDGESCTIEELNEQNGYKVICGGDSIGVVLNGAKGDQGEKGETGAKGDKGADGAKGADGTSCTAETLEGNSGYKIVCGGDSVGVVLNGAQGEKGDTGAKGDKGADGATGAAGTSCTAETLEGNSGYKIVCGSDSVNVCGRYIYDPNKNEECHEGVIHIRDTRVGGGDKLYKTVTIGTQIWMAENLNYETVNSYCYNDNTSNCDTYGRLYTWAAAMGKSEEECGEGKECNVTIFPHQGICPAGYHLPSDAEWNVLLNFVLADNNLGTTNKAATYLKSKTGWDSYNSTPAGNEKYGFNALPAGHRNSDESSYTYMGIETRIWSSTESSNTDAYYYFLSYMYEHLGRKSRSKTFAWSVRCLRD